MYVGVGDIATVVRWFNEVSRERLLCLFVARTSGDRSLLTELFDERRRISAELADNTAFFLFGEDPLPIDQMTELNEGDIHTHRIVPGLYKAAARGNFGNRDWYASWTPVEVDLVTDELRLEIVARSASAAREICDYFDLSADSAPCIVFLTRNNPLPFIVRTRGAADLRLFERFFAAVGEVAALLKSSGMLDLPIAIAQSQRLLDQRDDLTRQAREAEHLLAELIPNAQRAMSDYGEPKILEGLQADNAGEVFEILGLGANIRARVIHETGVALRIQQALLHEDVHRVLRQVKKNGVLLDRRRNEVNQVESRLRRLMTEALLDPVALMSRSQTVEQRLEEICREFERSFWWRHFRMPLGQFVRVATVNIHPCMGLRQGDDGPDTLGRGPCRDVRFLMISVGA